jgi:hypothetical protein
MPSFRERGGGGRVDGDLICDDTEEEARLGWRWLACLLVGWLAWILFNQRVSRCAPYETEGSDTIQTGFI